MFKSPLANRITIAKSLGFIIGLMGFCLLPSVFGETDLFLRFGILFWYTTMGAIIGIFGLIVKHPLFTSIKFPYWIRGAIMGGWLNLVLVLFMHDRFVTMLQSTVYADWSPFWIILEGAIIGIIIDFFATKYAGEGKKILK